ncbi:MAG: hypothetical protein IPM42_12565 [Saprospiraceae bacterium]|nr:hypothetical protein [Saprospiraceae bacterium]
MKIVFSVFLVLTIMSCQPKELPTILEQSDGYVLMKLSHQTTKTELESMSIKLANQNIEMDYSNSEFLEDGRLRILKLVVKTPDGSTGTTSADIVNLQYKYFGFLYDKAGAPVFRIGEM